MKRTLHQSEVSMFLKCGRQYNYRYIQGLKIPPRSALTVGTSVDKAITFNLDNKIKTGNLINVDDVVAVCSDTFDKLKDDTDFKDADPGEEKDCAIELTRLHCDKVAPSILPETVQEYFEIDSDKMPYVIAGTIDIVETTGQLRDSKTSKRQMVNSYQVKKRLQPAVYGLAYKATRKKNPSGFSFDILVKKSARIPCESVTVTDALDDLDYTLALNAFNQVNSALEAGIVLPAPEGAWWCQPEQCGYWSICKCKSKK